MEIAAGIDFGGSSAKIGLVNRRGRITAKTAVVMNPRDSFEGLVEPVASALRGLLAAQGSAQHMTTIGIGTPGFIDKNEGLLVGGCNNIPALQRRSVQRYLADAFGVPAFAENDGTAAAAGELAYGAGRTFANFLMITLGTAIGGGIVLDGKVYRSSRGFAAEIGHLCVNRGGLWCDCGSRGCFEQYASGTAIARIYGEKLRKRGQGGGNTEGTAVTPKMVTDRALAGDPLAVDVMEETGEWVAQAFGSLLNVLDLEACIVGGGVSEAGEILLEPIRRRLPDYCWPQICQGVKVVAAELRGDAGILGAAAQAFERVGC
ncbi:MAG: ROK family protein [Spirochaetia bacterium]